MKLQCWKCGTMLKDVIFPFSRYEECSVCKADQHVCMMCRDYNPNVADACMERRAEFVLDKEKANFCDFFKPRPRAYQHKSDDPSRAARQKLAELFGETANPDSPVTSTPQSEAEKALAELKRLFGENDI